MKNVKMLEPGSSREKHSNFIVEDSPQSRKVK